MIAEWIEQVIEGDSGFRVKETYEYLVFGDERQKVKQYGNAVTPPVMEWLIERGVESLK